MPPEPRELQLLRQLQRRGAGTLQAHHRPGRPEHPAELQVPHPLPVPAHHLRHPHLRPPSQHAHSPDGGDGGEHLQGERAHLAPTGEPGRVPSGQWGRGLLSWGLSSAHRTCGSRLGPGNLHKLPVLGRRKVGSWSKGSRECGWTMACVRGTQAYGCALLRVSAVICGC